MILLDIINHGTWNLFLQYATPIFFTWIIASGIFWVLFKISTTEKNDGIEFKVGFWICTVVCLGSIAYLLISALFNVGFGGGWIIALFGFIAYNVLKILSRH